MSENSHNEIWEKGRLFVCPDQKEELQIDEVHTNQGGFFKMSNGLYAHYSCHTELDKEIAKLGKSKIRKVPLNNGKSCTDFIKWWERIKESGNAENKG